MVHGLDSVETAALVASPAGAASPADRILGLVNQLIVLLSSIASVVVGVVFSRIAAEFILIVFRINEHLGAIRDQGHMN